jgi:hypothetical protein
MFPYACDAFANLAERLKESSLAGFSGAGIFQPMKITDAEAWRDQCRRQLERDVMTRIKYGFCRVHSRSWMMRPDARSRRWPSIVIGVSAIFQRTSDIVWQPGDKYAGEQVYAAQAEGLAALGVLPKVRGFTKTYLAPSP